MRVEEALGGAAHHRSWRGGGDADRRSARPPRSPRGLRCRDTSRTPRRRSNPLRRPRPARPWRSGSRAPRWSPRTPQRGSPVGVAGRRAGRVARRTARGWRSPRREADRRCSPSDTGVVALSGAEVPHRCGRSYRCPRSIATIFTLSGGGGPVRRLTSQVTPKLMSIPMVPMPSGLIPNHQASGPLHSNTLNQPI